MYVAKGLHGVREDPVDVLFEHPAPRLWAELHERYHEVREDRLARNREEGPQDLYQQLAAKCKAERKTDSRGVLAVVCEYYTTDAKKGWNPFICKNTFCKVFALVNGDECKAWLYEQLERDLFR